ncbi:MAG TPA: indole-3-glycerol phosphate synthase TrpC [Solirubrobacteraceae bacterium]|nr:indole-3-glycerol phosphate synthase TrpC [Solirubrobacteraceae bacterium]
MTVLGSILESTRAEVARRKRETPDPGGSTEGVSTNSMVLRARARTRAAPSNFANALTRPGIGVIAEFKRRSPSAGPLRDDPDVAELVSAYERGGASALSVLTEGPHFGGSLEDLRAARAACGLPILRKDFIVDPYQLHEALAAGADAVLLIVAALAPDELGALHEQARALGLDVLVEVHDLTELQIALDVGARLIGVNNRDLRDFSIDLGRTLSLMPRIPEGVTVVSESGIAGPDQLRSLREAGVQAVLVGETLMRAPDPQAALRDLMSIDTFTQSDDLL